MMTGNAKSQHVPVGELRPSQMLYTFGIGAIVDLPKIAAMVMGLDDWDVPLCAEVTDPRLLAAVRTVLGNQVKRLRKPPAADRSGGAKPDSIAVPGVPVAPFPRWMVCPVCRLLTPLEAGMIELRVDRYRADRTAYVHAGCNPARRSQPEMVPVRFVVTCRHGHLDDFPWRQFLHGSGSLCNGALRLLDQGVSGEASDVYVKCDVCQKSRPMSDAFGGDGGRGAELPPCTGRRPHLRDYESGPCTETAKAILFGASNFWFPLSLSSLHVPATSSPLSQLVEEHWATLKEVENEGDLKFLDRRGELTAFAHVSLEQLFAAIETVRTGGDTGEADPSDLKTPEWEAFADPDPSRNSGDFWLTAVAPPESFESVIEKVVLVERLREVRALTGFTRLESPGDFSDVPEVPSDVIAPLSRKPPGWVPANEVRGEGVFVHFRGEVLEAWTRKPAVAAMDGLLYEAHKRWREHRRLRPPEAGYPGIAYVVLHSFAHALMRQLSMECGYTSAGIRERIYYRAPGGARPPMAGVLIYTAAPDSEGTLGGLVALGDPKALGRHIGQALEMVSLCAADPLCAEHHPYRDGITRHGAACHACLFVPETACERGNAYLDRTVLTATVQSSDMAFFPAEG